MNTDNKNSDNGEDIDFRKNKTFFTALMHAVDGIIGALKAERNLKIELSIGLIAIILGLVLKLSNKEWVLLFFTIFFVIFAELMNTAIEHAVDLITTKYNEKAKLAKDISAGAVLVVCILSVIMGFYLFFDKIIALIV